MFSLTLPASSMNSRVEVVLARLPGEVERVDRDAVAAEAGARLEAHEAERLRRGRVDDLPDVDAHPVAELRELVDERDVDRAEDVLEQLRQLGRLGRRDGVDGVDDAAVELGRARACDASSMPPTTFGTSSSSSRSLPGSTRSGEKARWKSSPASRPESPRGSAARPRASCPGRSSTRARRAGPCAAAARCRATAASRSRGRARAASRAASAARSGSRPRSRARRSRSSPRTARARRAAAASRDGTSSMWLSPRLIASTTRRSTSTSSTSLPASANTCASGRPT